MIFFIRGILASGDDCVKRLITGMAAVIMAAILFFPGEVFALSAEHAILMDAATGRVIYEKGADQRSLIASTTKIMTALVVCEQCNVLDRMRIPKEAIGVEGSSMYLREGEILTIQELLYGLMLQSGNDAAVALAIYCGGTVEGFAELMNDKARQLGLADTHFVNPHGLDAPEHYSTARDLAILASYAMKNPIFAGTVSAKTVNIGQRSLTNHNKILWRVDGADGVKTGFTKASGRVLVSSATRDGRRLVCVTINAPDDWNDHKLLLEDGFSRFQPVNLVNCGDVLGTIPVLGGESTYAHLIADDDFEYPMAEGEQVSIQLPPILFVYAPIAWGQRAGWAHILVEGVPVGKVPLLYGETVEKTPDMEPSLWEKLFGGAS